MGRSEPCRKWAVVEILIYPALGFPESCLSAYGQPGRCERTSPAVVPTDIAKVKTIVDSQMGSSEALFRNLSSYQARVVPAICVFSAVTNPTDPVKGAHSSSCYAHQQ